MQSAAVPCTSNGMKRTAACALLSDPSGSSNSSQNNRKDDRTDMDPKSQSISPPPPEKRSFIVIESPLKLDTIDSAEDLDLKVLKIQNKNLSEKLLKRKRQEEELKEKLDGLQNRKLIDDNKLCIMDRYWTQLDEDLRLILERFDNTSAENSKLKEPNDKKSSSPAIRNFLSKLNDWDKVELEDNLKDRVKFTTQTVAKLITNYDRITKRMEQYYKEHSGSQEKMDVTGSSDKKQELMDENTRLNELITKCQSKTHQVGLERKQLEDQIVKLESEIKELTLRCDSSEYDLEKFRDKAFKLDRQLADTIVKLTSAQQQIQSAQDQANSNMRITLNNQLDKNGHLVLHSNSTASHHSSRGECRTTTLTDKQITEMESELEENKELAASRLQELEKQMTQYQAALKQIEKLKAEAKLVPESVVSETTEYRQLQTKYTLVVSDNIKLKSALDESKNLIEASRVTFQRQLEAMESDELNQQKRLGNEMMQLEEQLTQVRKENELLRIEYEQNVAANEQTGPINKEMRSLITTLQTDNKLLKSDNVRTKKRLEEIQQETEKLKKQIAQQHQNRYESKSGVKLEPQMLEMSPDIKKERDSSRDSQIKESKDQKLAEDKKPSKQSLQSPNVSSGQNPKQKIVELDEAKLEIKRLKEALDRYKSNKATQQQADNVNSHNSQDDSSHNPLPGVDYSKKIKSLEETIRELHKNLNSKKQEETALLNDMEITGQAFEDMQEQNVRLMQQLREKDDANFKLVSERIKLENVQKILKEEKEIYVQQVVTLQEQLEAQMCISKKLEEQLLLANQTILLTEKDIGHWQHSCENYRRQALDHVQLIQDLKLNTQKYLGQLKEVQGQIAEKSESLASQSFMNKRLQEEIKHLQIEIERQKKFEMASNMDEVLMEEIKEYKEQLRCPSCKVKQKDAVLTKCFHVFCFDCLQKRYDTRQRKCPKCNHGFGANDFRKLYLS